MQILIPNLKAWPDVANPAVWCELIDCSLLTMRRAEKSGVLVPAGTKAHKLYTKSAILRWLGIPE
jgi:hypothetical protein